MAGSVQCSYSKLHSILFIVYDYIVRGRALNTGRPKICQNITAYHNLICQLLNMLIGSITANNN